MKRTEFNDYGMDSSIRETSIIHKAEQTIREGGSPRESYDQAVREKRENEY